MAGAHFPHPISVSVAPIESEERDVVNTSPELVMMAPHSNVCDYRPNTNESLCRVITTETTKEASAEKPGSGQGSPLGWTIYSGDKEPLPVPMITLASSWISPKSMSVSTFTQGGTPKSLVSPLGTYKQQLLSLDRALSKSFPRQYGASDEVPSPL